MDVAAAKAQAARLTDQAAELDQIKNRVASHRGSTDSAWQASEVPMITGAMETTERQLANKAQELRNIASDIVSVALEIQAEEEAAARAAAAKAAAEAAARAEAERVQREQEAARQAQATQAARAPQSNATSSSRSTSVKTNSASKTTSNSGQDKSSSIIDFFKNLF